MRRYNEQENAFIKEEKHWIRKLKALWETGRKQEQSIDIYNNLLYWIKHEETQHPEQLIMAKILKDREEIDLLYSLVVNA